MWLQSKDADAQGSYKKSPMASGSGYGFGSGSTSVSASLPTLAPSSSTASLASPASASPGSFNSSTYPQSLSTLRQRFLPKIDFGQVTEGNLRFQERPVDYFLWRFIAPGGTAFFMVVWSVWYKWKAAQATDPEQKRALNGTAAAFMAWGIFNGACYIALAWIQKLRADEQRGQKPSLGL